jgi:HlyD family secretion protein
MELSTESSKTNHQTWRARRRWILVAAGILLAGGTLAWFLLRGSSAATSTPAAQTQVNTAAVRRANLRITSIGSGTLVASQLANVSFTAPGIISELNVKVGDSVKKGDILARLGDMSKLQANVASSELAVLQAQQALDALTTNSGVTLANAYKTFIDAQQTYVDSQTTSERTSYARCSKETNIQLTAKYQTALDNLNKIALRNYGSDPWINAKNVYDTAYANWQYCQAYTQGETTNAKASTDIAKQTMDQAQAQYELLSKSNGIDPNELALDKSKLNQAQLQLQSDQKVLEGATMTAPMDGTVISIAADKGEMVDTSTFITLANLQTPNLNVQINEADLPKISIGNKTEITFDAISNQVFTGKIIQIDPALVTSGQYQVAQGLVSLDQAPTNNGQPLPLGVTATVNIISKEANNALLVPVDALRDLGNGEYGVFVMNSNHQLRFTTVQVGIQDSTSAEIVKGLNQGQIVSTGMVKTIN